MKAFARICLLLLPVLAGAILLTHLHGHRKDGFPPMHPVISSVVPRKHGRPAMRRSAISTRFRAARYLYLMPPSDLNSPYNVPSFSPDAGGLLYDGDRWSGYQNTASGNLSEICIPVVVDFGAPRTVNGFYVHAVYSQELLTCMYMYASNDGSHWKFAGMAYLDNKKHAFSHPVTGRYLEVCPRIVTVPAGKSLKISEAAFFDAEGKTIDGPPIAHADHTRGAPDAGAEHTHRRRG